MDATEPGRLLAGRYRLTAVIGSGGMGMVWRGHDELLGRDVAVKEIIWPPHLTEQEQQLACRRGAREAQMAGRLNHRNVVRIYDFVEEDGHPCIVMEFLPYRSLRDLLKEEGPLPPDRAAQIGLGVLAALAAAHAEGILHRDVKPANILVGPDGRVVLTDFGIARAADSPTLTTDGVLLGSPSYIAPERARNGHSVAGPPGDLWSLGVSLYTAVEGHPPFERDGALATLTAVVADEPDQALYAGPLEPVISGLLRKDPGQRLGAAEAERLLRQVAEQHVQPMTAPAAPPPADLEPWQPAPPRPGMSRGLLLTLTVLFAAAATVTGLAFTAPQAPPASGASGVGGSPAGGTLPAGYHRFTNATRFSIGVPDGWQVFRKGHIVYVTDPSDSDVFLLIDQSGHPKPSREFTYVKDGVLVHILNRNIMANDSHAYALSWSAPESDWSADYHYFQTFAATFRPASPQTGHGKKQSQST
jgi:tRNA A-37 threonylcarbamoyl transferase component Bud32